MTAPELSTPPNLSHMAAAFAQAKADETRAADLRKDLAAQIQLLTGHTAESSKTYKDGDWKIVVKQPVNRAMDWAAWETVKLGIPEELWPVEMKPCLDEKGIKWIQDNDAAIYQILSGALTTKPGAVSVTVTHIEPKE
jgi:hypothetical protein